MKRKEFHQIVISLTDKLYRFAYLLIPDDLQAEQLVIDATNAYLLKERKKILRTVVDLTDKRATQLLRRVHYKGILRHVCEIGTRRSLQLVEQLKVSRPADYAVFYSLDPKVRFIMGLRYEAQFNVEEIEEIVQLPRFEVIEKIHNGRFLLLNDLNQGLSL